MRARFLLRTHALSNQPGGNEQVSLASSHRHLDLPMMAGFNSKERTEKDWRELFTDADERFSPGRYNV